MKIFTNIKTLAQTTIAFTLAISFAFIAGAQAAQLSLLSENGQPVVGADILIGSAEGSPFAGNRLKTDLNGQVTIPAEWQTQLPITITAGGFLTATFLSVPPVDNIFQIHREDAKMAYEVKGDTTGYTNLERDGKVDFSIVLPALRQRQLAQFDMSNVISPEVDVLTIITQEVPVPSNLALPRQRENYVLPVTLDKPLYRMSFKQSGDYRMTGLHGQFPIRQVVGDIRDGKAFYEVINYFRMIGGGQRDVVVNNSLAGQDIPINQMNFDKKMVARGPADQGDMVMFSIALANSGGLFYPTDVKRILPNENVELLSSSRVDQRSLVSLMMTKADADNIGGNRKKDGNPFGLRQSVETDLKTFYNQFVKIFGIADAKLNMRLRDRRDPAAAPGSGSISIALQSEAQNTPIFLGLIPRPVLADGKLKLVAPLAPAGIEPVATFAIFSEIERKSNDHYTTENRFRLWEVSQLGWNNELVLPAAPVARDPNKHYRWEVLFMGRQTGQTDGSGVYFLDAITHISRNSLDL